jgi:hypothetical protein
MVHERLRESGEDPVTVSLPRSGSLGGSGASVLGSVGLGVSSSVAEKGDREDEARALFLGLGRGR